MEGKDPGLGAGVVSRAGQVTLFWPEVSPVFVSFILRRLSSVLRHRGGESVS